MLRSKIKLCICSDCLEPLGFAFVVAPERSAPAFDRAAAPHNMCCLFTQRRIDRHTVLSLLPFVKVDATKRESERQHGLDGWSCLIIDIHGADGRRDVHWRHAAKWRSMLRHFFHFFVIVSIIIVL